jgi:hypothetical protein
MNAIALSSVFSSLLTRYRRQISDLDDATDQTEIDRLTAMSEDTLLELAHVRPRDASALADKIDALIRRYSDFDALPMDHARELLLDARHLSTDVGMILSWVNQWADLGGTLMIHPNGDRIVGLPEPLKIGDCHTGPLPPHLQLHSQEEALGAAKTLQAMLKLAGQRMIDGVFAFAPVAREAEA